MGDKTFYDEHDPDEAMRIYCEQRGELYETVKERVIKEVLSEIYDSSNGLAGQSVLEIGSAGGIFTSWFLAQGSRVTCVDICEPIMKKSRELYGEATFIVGDATRVMIQDGENSFDLIFAKDVIEHIQEDEVFLNNMFRYLKPGGAIVIVTQNSRCLNYLVQGGYHFLRGNWPWYGWDHTHVRFYNAPLLQSKLVASGFEARGWFGSYYFPYRLLRDHFGSWVESRLFCLPEILHINRKWPFSKLGWSIGVYAIKPCTMRPVNSG